MVVESQNGYMWAIRVVHEVIHSCLSYHGWFWRSESDGRGGCDGYDGHDGCGCSCGEVLYGPLRVL